MNWLKHINTLHRRQGTSGFPLSAKFFLFVCFVLLYFVLFWGPRAMASIKK